MENEKSTDFGENEAELRRMLIMKEIPPLTMKRFFAYLHSLQDREDWGKDLEYKKLKFVSDFENKALSKYYPDAKKDEIK